MTSKDKDTIYIDIDDEITGIIDKLTGSDGKVVALVLPKRAAVFQSIVNMKLLKRSADSAKKNLVLITSEVGLLPLAGVAGVHVAKTLSSKPEIPLAPNAPDDGEETIQEDGEEVDTLPDRSKTIGQLASAGAAGAAADGVETLTLDDDLPPEVADAVKPGAGSKTFEPPKPKKNKKLRIPNFERFRLLLILGGLLLILLIGGLIFVTKSLPKATITIKTNATNVDTNLNLNLSAAAKALDAPSNTLPAKLASQPKTYTQQVPTTGQKNNGSKASGSVGMTAKVCGAIPDSGPADVPAGTGLSNNGLTYITQQDTAFSSTPTGPPQNHCLNYGATSNTAIQAQSGGANYNGATNFSVAGRSDVSTQVASSISGGTDSIVQIVNQNDITSAKSKIAPSDTDLKQTLESQLKANNYYPIVATYVAGTPAASNSANVGDIANSVTVTETITYTMFGVHQSDLNTLIDNNIKGQIDTSKQSILDNGLSSGVFNVNNISPTNSQLTLSTKATAGSQLDVNTIRQQAAGKQAGAIKSQLSSNPDVTSVDVKLSPFWVSSAPKNTSRITVNIAKPTGNPKASTSSASKP